MASSDIRMTPVFFHVLLSLTQGPRHPYAVLGEIEERSGGSLSLGPSSLYYAVGRLEDAGWIREIDEVPESDEPHEDQRRYYVLTDRGHMRLEEELATLADIVDRARGMGLAPERAAP